MRKIKNIFILSLLMIVTCAGCIFDWNSHDTNVKVTEDKNNYQFTASYNKHRSAEIQHYINTDIAPDNLSGDFIDVTTTLKDGTTFYIKEMAGLLKIKLDKQKNSEASYEKIKNMCNGIKNILTNK